MMEQRLKQNIYRTWLPVFILIGIALVLRAFNLGKEFSGDETMLIGISQQEINKMLPSIVKTDIYPPLTYFVIHYLAKFGKSGIWLRIYFVLFGIGCCSLVYMIAKEFLDTKLATIALLLAAFSPLLIFASQYARSYIDSSFWMLLSCLFMLKILKGEERAINWSGYIISVVLGLYTFYFSALLFIAQFIFVIASRLKDIRSVLKWNSAYAAAALLYAPWIPSAFRQFHNTSSLAYSWSDKGFNLGSFRIGLYARNFSALLGFDPYFFLYQGGIAKHFSTTILVIGILGCVSILVLFLYQCLKFLKIKYSEKSELVWFLPSLSLGPIILSWIAAFTLNILPNARYLIAFHALFLILIATFIYRARERSRLFGNTLLVIMLLIFAARIPYAVASEFDAKGTALFLKNNLKPGEPVICARSSPNDNSLDIIDISDRFKLNDNRSAYVISPPGSLGYLRSKILPFKRVWVYKVYGNAEIFGVNRLLDDWLKGQGYHKINENKFRNIDIVEYEK